MVGMEGWAFRSLLTEGLQMEKIKEQLRQRAALEIGKWEGGKVLGAVYHGSDYRELVIPTD